MTFGSTRNLAMLLNSLPQIKINGSLVPYVDQAKNLGLIIAPSLNWKPHITFITNKIYATLRSLNFHSKSLNVPLRKQLIQTLALPHFDYASIKFMNSDKSRSLALQTAKNACIRFIFGNITHIPMANITSHITHRRSHLSWLSIASHHHLKLASFAYSVLTKKHPSYLSTHLNYTPKPLHMRRPKRTPPQEFDYVAPRKAAWENFFTVSAKELPYSLAITEFDVRRLKEFKTWCFQLFLLLEIESWHSKYFWRLSPTHGDLVSALPYSPLKSISFHFHHHTP